MKGRIRKLAGERFGRLVVIRLAKKPKGKGASYLCKCDCGKTKTILGNSLIQGATRSCGCLKAEIHRKELTGKQIGDWKVLGPTARRSAKGYMYWSCKCKCGQTMPVLAETLLNGRSSCCVVCAGEKRRKQHCYRGHDTHVWERTSSQACRACLRDKALRTHYGITLTEYIALYEAQNGKCAICAADLGTYLPGKGGFGQTTLVEVDHDHSKSGKESVRGLLCGRNWKGCNRRLGYIETTGWLEKTLAYLKNPPAQKYLKETS